MMHSSSRLALQQFTPVSVLDTRVLICNGVKNKREKLFNYSMEIQIGYDERVYNSLLILPSKL